MPCSRQYCLPWGQDSKSVPISTSIYIYKHTDYSHTNMNAHQISPSSINQSSYQMAYQNTHLFPCKFSCFTLYTSRVLSHNYQHAWNFTIFYSFIHLSNAFFSYKSPFPCQFNFLSTEFKEDEREAKGNTNKEKKRKEGKMQEQLVAIKSWE